MLIHTPHGGSGSIYAPRPAAIPLGCSARDERLEFLYALLRPGHRVFADRALLPQTMTALRRAAMACCRRLVAISLATRSQRVAGVVLRLRPFERHANSCLLEQRLLVGVHGMLQALGAALQCLSRWVIPRSVRASAESASPSNAVRDGLDTSPCRARSRPAPRPKIQSSRKPRGSPACSCRGPGGAQWVRCPEGGRRRLEPPQGTGANEPDHTGAARVACAEAHAPLGVRRRNRTGLRLRQARRHS